MDGFPVLLLVLPFFGACGCVPGARRREVDRGRETEVKGLWGQRLREALAHRDPGPLWSSGAPRRRLLYCDVGIGFHLQVLSGGAVRGAHHPNESCCLRVTSVSAGVVRIQGYHNKLFLCMQKGGRVYTSLECSKECHWKETLEENHYNTYSSALYPGLYLGLSPKGHVKRGSNVNPRQPCAHFLPRTL